MSPVEALTFVDFQVGAAEVLVSEIDSRVERSQVHCKTTFRSCRRKR